MEFTASQIALMLGAEIEGDAGCTVRNIAPVDKAGPGDLTFLANPKYKLQAAQTQASVLLAPLDFQEALRPGLTVLRVENPYQALARLLAEVERLRKSALLGIESPVHIGGQVLLGEEIYIGAFAYIASGARIGKRVKIYPGVYIGEGVSIGDDTLIYPQAVLYAGVSVGQRCILHAGCRIGADGFGFTPDSQGAYQKIPQVGRVMIEDDVEIGANTCIDRATLGETVIRSGSKLDNLIQVAHNVEIGSHTAIAAQAGIAGSTRIGNRSQIGGQAGIVGHLSLAEGTKIDAQSGVNRSIETPGQAFRGSPIQPYRQQLRTEVLLRQLEELHQRVISLEKLLADRT